MATPEHSKELEISSGMTVYVVGSLSEIGIPPLVSDYGQIDRDAWCTYKGTVVSASEPTVRIMTLRGFLVRSFKQQYRDYRPPLEKVFTAKELYDSLVLGGLFRARKEQKVPQSLTTMFDKMLSDTENNEIVTYHLLQLIDSRRKA